MMDFSKKGLSCAEAKEMDMVQYLSSLGYEPTKIKANDYWYLSPLHAEKTASFKINKKLNRWYDHGLGKGGNLVDFAIQYHDCTVGDFLKLLKGDFPFQQPHIRPVTEVSTSEPKIELGTIKSIRSIELLYYLRERRIDQQVADQFCKEISYNFSGKNYYALGFKNDAGGYELRNRFFKGSSSPKGITHLKNGADTLVVLEGFFDFLSYQTIVKRMDVPTQDFLILNSLSFFDKAIPLMQQYDCCRLFLDNDAAGQNCSRQTVSMDSRFQDESGMYHLYKDLNDYLTGNRLQL